MLIYARKAMAFTKGVGFEEFCADERTQAATLHVLQIVGEAASKVSRALREAHPEIPWQRIINLRHRLVQDYPRIELPKVWGVVENQLRGLVTTLEALTPNKGENESDT